MVLGLLILQNGPVKDIVPLESWKDTIHKQFEFCKPNVRGFTQHAEVYTILSSTPCKVLLEQLLEQHEQQLEFSS